VTVRSIRRQILGVALVTALLAGAFILWPTGRHGYDALLLLGDLIGYPLPGALDGRPNAERRTLAFQSNGRSYRGDLYTPQGPVTAGIVFVPGAAQLGKDDPRVVDLAMSLARARFSVLVPDVVALRELRLLADSAHDIGDALSWMLEQPELTPSGRLGLVTTSVAIGPAVLALLDQGLSGAVRFVLSVGGYHDLRRTLTYLTTGYYAAHGISLRRPPNEYGKWVYALSNAVRLEEPSDRQAFEALAWRKLRNPDAAVSALVARLGPEGKAAYEFIVNTEPGRSGALLLALPSRLRADVAALDLASHDLGTIQARFILVHGVDDHMIPYGESLGLVRALPPGQGRLFLLQGFNHVDISPQFADGWRLWRAIYELLREREV
jgi:hypothetical protein